MVTASASYLGTDPTARNFAESKGTLVLSQLRQRSIGASESRVHITISLSPASELLKFHGSAREVQFPSLERRSRTRTRGSERAIILPGSRERCGIRIRTEHGGGCFIAGISRRLRERFALDLEINRKQTASDASAFPSRCPGRL